MRWLFTTTIELLHGTTAMSQDAIIEGWDLRKESVSGNSFVKTREASFIMFTYSGRRVSMCASWVVWLSVCPDAVDRDKAEVCLAYREVMWSWSYTVIVDIKGVVKLPIMICFIQFQNGVHVVFQGS